MSEWDVLPPVHAAGPPLNEPSLGSLGGDLAEEDAKFAAFLHANGWSGEMGASESVDDLVAEKGEKSEY
jgi:hypothetical protein